MGFEADRILEESMLAEFDMDESLHRVKRTTRGNFVWTDIKGGKHKLKDIDDRYLANIINFVKRKRKPRFNPLIEFLEKEQQHRAKHNWSIMALLTQIKGIANQTKVNVQPGEDIIVQRRNKSGKFVKRGE